MKRTPFNTTQFENAMLPALREAVIGPLRKPGSRAFQISFDLPELATIEDALKWHVKKLDFLSRATALPSTTKEAYRERAEVAQRLFSKVHGLGIRLARRDKETTP